MSRHRERGIAFLTATATLASLTVVVVGLATTAIVDQRLGHNAVQAAQAEALARSGIAGTLVVLAERGAAAPDLLSAQWALGRQSLGRGWVEVTVEDEARRLDIGAPELPVLLAQLGIDARRAAGLATPDPERLLGPSLGDRGRAAGLDVATLRRLLPHVGTSGETQVNPNTASREVLLAVVGDRVLVEEWLRTRTQAPIDPASAPPAVAARLTTRGQYYRIDATGGAGAARRRLRAVVRVLDGSDPTVLQWQYLVDDAPER